jgi:XRE family transcriptional regulator, fatty acid utilization regulator
MKTDYPAQIADRLRLAREELGLTLDQAAQETGFNNYQTISSIEKGERSVKVTDLVRFAQAYGRSIDFFLAPEAPAPKPAVRWRGGENVADRPKAERRFLQFCEDYARLEELARVKPAGLPRTCASPPATFADAEALAQATLRLMELGSRPALALRDVLEGQYGVKVLVEYAAGGSAACTQGRFGTGIFINGADAPWRRNYDIAHELYHLLTWDALSALPEPGVGPIDEQYADCFASVLLLPSDIVRAEFKRRIGPGGLPFADVVTMAREFGVSTQALLWRLVNLNLVDKDSVKLALANETLKQTDRAERRKDSDQWQVRQSLRFVSLAFECLQNGTLSRGRFADMMGIKRGAVGPFLAEYGFDETGDYSGQVSAA